MFGIFGRTVAHYSTGYQTCPTIRRSVNAAAALSLSPCLALSSDACICRCFLISSIGLLSVKTVSDLLHWRLSHDDDVDYRSCYGLWTWERMMRSVESFCACVHEHGNSREVVNVVGENFPGLADIGQMLNTPPTGMESGELFCTSLTWSDQICEKKIWTINLSHEMQTLVRDRPPDQCIRDHRAWLHCHVVVKGMRSNECPFSLYTVHLLLIIVNSYL